MAELETIRAAVLERFPVSLEAFLAPGRRGRPRKGQPNALAPAHARAMFTVVARDDRHTMRSIAKAVGRHEALASSALAQGRALAQTADWWPGVVAEIRSELGIVPPWRQGVRDPRMRRILRAVGARYGLTPAQLVGRPQDLAVSHPRAVALYLGYLLTPLTTRELGEIFGRGPGTVSTILKRARRDAETPAWQNDLTYLMPRLGLPIVKDLRTTERPRPSRRSALRR